MTEVEYHRSLYDPPKAKGIFGVPPHVFIASVVVVGLLFALLAFYFINLKRNPPKWFLRAAVLAIPLPWIAAELGWVLAETGRQPWIIYGIMRTDESLTPMPGVGYFFVVITAVYLVLAVLVTMLMTWLIQDANARYSKGGGSNS